VTHVNVARPKFLDLAASPVSDSIKRIVDFINANKKCNRKKLLAALAPKTEPKAEQEPDAAPELTPDQQAVLTDLHWLIHQGHVMEFANGRIELAAKPAAQKKAEAKAAQQAEQKPETPPTETTTETTTESAQDGLIISE
jgi:hypothetical protein